MISREIALICTSLDLTEDKSIIVGSGNGFVLSVLMRRVKCLEGCTCYRFGPMVFSMSHKKMFWFCFVLSKIYYRTKKTQFVFTLQVEIMKGMSNTDVFIKKRGDIILSWWCNQMETFSALLPICAGNSPVTGEFPAQRPVTRSFDVFFDLRLNGRLSKQSWGWWFGTPSRPLWRHSNVWVMPRMWEHMYQSVLWTSLSILDKNGSLCSWLYSNVRFSRLW